MIDPQSHDKLKRTLSERIQQDKHILDNLCAEVRPLTQPHERCRDY